MAPKKICFGNVGGRGVDQTGAWTSTNTNCLPRTAGYPDLHNDLPFNPRLWSAKVMFMINEKVLADSPGAFAKIES